MDVLSFANPVFAAYAVAATLMILMVSVTSWLTVARMLQVNGGFRAPEDLRRTPLNRNPDPGQLAPNEKVERVRRIQGNNIENIPFFLAAGLLYVLTAPSLLAARLAFYGYVVSRFLHFLAYLTAQTHDVRSIFWTVGSLILIFITVRALLAAVGV
ncbi:MAG TPA: MAPEG family protein [Roseiarcus sp.]|nr:MAPEG family protein [Roseiarcus sp.]